MAKNKFYVVWRGRQVGVFDSWDQCKVQVEGFNCAQYKGFPNRPSAEAAFKAGYENQQEAQGMMSMNLPDSVEKPIGAAIAVDSACSGNPGKMEYRGVFVETGSLIFQSRVYEQGTNNIGEFLAIVHCLAWQQKKHTAYPIYSDSMNAMKWVSEGRCRTKLVENDKNCVLFDVIRRAEKWLHENTFRLPLYKWKTEIWGEIPADFGRKENC